MNRTSMAPSPTLVSTTSFYWCSMFRELMRNAASGEIESPFDGFQILMPPPSTCCSRSATSVQSTHRAGFLSVSRSLRPDDRARGGGAARDAERPPWPGTGETNTWLRWACLRNRIRATGLTGGLLVRQCRQRREFSATGLLITDGIAPIAAARSRRARRGWHEPQEVTDTTSRRIAAIGLIGAVVEGWVEEMGMKCARDLATGDDEGL